VRAVLDQPDDAGESHLQELRSAMEAQPFIAAIKHVLGRRGLPISPDLRPPMRSLTAEEASRLDASLVLLEAPLAV
jgi:dihydrodipicolinate synthase/N-acetylneuraminate lyase